MIRQSQVSRTGRRLAGRALTAAVLTLTPLAALAQAKEGKADRSVGLPQTITATDPQLLIGQVISVVLGSVGVIALAMFIYGGVQMMTASGDAGKYSNGKGTMIWATIGLVLVFASYGVVNTIINALGQS